MTTDNKNPSTPASSDARAPSRQSSSSNHSTENPTEGSGGGLINYSSLTEQVLDLPPTQTSGTEPDDSNSHPSIKMKSPPPILPTSEDDLEKKAAKDQASVDIESSNQVEVASPPEDTASSVNESVVPPPPVLARGVPVATTSATPGAYHVGGTPFAADDNETLSPSTVMMPEPQEPTFTEPTVTAQLAPTDDEVMKRFVEDIPVAEAEAAPNRKRWIILGGIGLLACAGLGAGLGVALSGDDSSPRVAPPPPIRADTCLPVDTDNPGLFNCYKEDFPFNDTTTIFFNCPTNDEEQIFNCEFCGVLPISNIEEIEEDTAPALCSGCIICEDSVSFDCTNLFPEEECALQTCSGNCGKDPVPSPSPDTEANECQESVELDTYFCNKEDIPFDFLVTQFQDCPPGAENNVYECQSCFVVFEDTVADIDAATSQICRWCINCGDSVAFDCSNLFPGQECAAVDCDGTCIGDRQA